MTSSPLYTIGYAGHSWESFLDTLVSHGITQLADVRDAPISRKPGFGKNQLRNGLVEAGIEYRHFVDLGTPKMIRDPWKAGSLTPETFYAAYLEHLLGVGEDDLAALWEWSRQAPTAMLCLESHAEDCHRLIVANEMAARFGAAIVHL